MKIFVAQMNPIVGDIQGNSDKIIAAIEEGKRQGADVVLTPELALCGYPPEDFLLLPHFSEAVEEVLQTIVEASSGIAVVVGLARRNHAGTIKPLHNSAAIIENRVLLGFQDKSLLPTYDVFDERRYFEPASEVKVWKIGGSWVAVTICEDIWQHGEKLRFSRYDRDPVQELRDANLDVLLNLSSSPYHQGKLQTRIEVGMTAARTLGCPLITANQVGGNDSLIFDGHSYFVAPEGLMGLAKGFEVDGLVWDSSDRSACALPQEGDGELYQALVLGLRDYFQKQGFTSACLGLSGGVDSALVAALAVDALGAENVLTVAMPSRYSSEGSLSDAKALAENFGVRMEVISIEEAFTGYLNLLGPYFGGKPVDATEENLQARIRGMILMALSNKHGYIVLSTGNKSELAMGYSTLYGDLAGGLAVISDLNKQQVYALCRWRNREREMIPQAILDKPPSAELRPDQKDSDTLPDYAIIDAVLEGYIVEHLSPEEISDTMGVDLVLVQELVERIHRNEYKRRQAPPGLRVSEKAFSVGRRFPIVQKWV